MISLSCDHDFALAAVSAIGRIGGHRAMAVLAELLCSDAIAENDLRGQIVVALACTRDPAAFPILEHLGIQTGAEFDLFLPDALTATGGDRAINALRAIWASRPSARKHILRCLFWLSSTAATDAILDLVDLEDYDELRLLLSCAAYGGHLAIIGGRIGLAVDPRIVSLLVSRFDSFQPPEQEAVLRVAEQSGMPQARHLLERVATDPIWEIALPQANPAVQRTLRSVAVDQLLRLGSPVVLDRALDMLDGTDRGRSMAFFWLERMPREVVEHELQQQLLHAQREDLPDLLTLIGWLGSAAAAPAVRPYQDDPDPQVFDPAYEAEQRLLGLLE